jgi:hypothetical protein
MTSLILVNADHVDKLRVVIRPWWFRLIPVADVFRIRVRMPKSLPGKELLPPTR